MQCLKLWIAGGGLGVKPHTVNSWVIALHVRRLGMGDKPLSYADCLDLWPKMLLPDAFCRLQSTKCDFGRGFAPDPTGAPYSAPLDRHAGRYFSQGGHVRGLSRAIFYLSRGPRAHSLALLPPSLPPFPLLSPRHSAFFSVHPVQIEG